MNQIDMEEEDDDIMKYKTFQNYIKRILRHKKPGINNKGKKIKWTLYKEYLYNLKFLVFIL